MSEAFWSRLSLITGMFALAVLIGVCSFAANFEVRDLDIWLHLGTGRHIALHHDIPKNDILSCTIAGKPWVNHEWLFQLIIFTVHQAAGFEGLLTMQSIVVSLTLLLLFLMTYRRDRMILGVFTLTLVMLIYHQRFTLRPDLFSLLFFTLYMGILAFHLDKRWSIWAVALIQVLWANMHGYFFFGPLMVIIAIIAEAVKRFVPLPYEWNKVGRLDDVEYRVLLIMLAVSVAACFINPYGAAGASYPLQVLFHSASDTKIFFKYITELQPSLSPDFLGKIQENIYYKLVLLISAITFFFNRRRLDISVLLVWLAFLGFSLVAIRNMVFFAFAAYLVIMVNSMTISLSSILPMRFTEPKFEHITSIMGKVLLIVWIFSIGEDMASRGHFNFETMKMKSEIGGVGRSFYPSKAVDFMANAGVRGNIFNDFNSGSFLVGRMHPKIRVFIDGRTEVYGAKFFMYYKKIWMDGDKKALEEAINRYGLTAALLNGVKQSVSSKVIQNFSQLKDWKLVYFNDDGLVYLKKTAQNQPVIDKYAIDLSKWEPPKFDLVRMGLQRAVPLPYLARARYLMAYKLDGPALKELKTALIIAPDAMEIYGLLGDIYGHQKKYRLAFENFRIASSYSSSYHNVMGLAWGLDKIGRPDEARKLYETLLKKNPKNKAILDRIKALKPKEKK